jgi:hypothetical protein
VPMLRRRGNPLHQETWEYDERYSASFTTSSSGCCGSLRQLDLTDSQYSLT